MSSACISDAGRGASVPAIDFREWRWKQVKHGCTPPHHTQAMHSSNAHAGHTHAHADKRVALCGALVHARTRSAHTTPAARKLARAACALDVHFWRERVAGCVMGVRHEMIDGHFD